MEKHVVVIYPHPDDESFGAAGTITQFREQGVPVTYLCGTLGEMGRNMGSPPFANRETLPEIRREELLQACDVLDVKLNMLGYRDKTLEYEDRQEVAAHIKSILEDIEPSLVITHYPDYAVHPDHNALGAAVMEAVKQMNPEKRPTVWAQAITNDFPEVLGEPDIKHDITDQIDKKIKAIFSHKSQAGGVLSQFKKTGDTATDVKAEAKKRMGTEQFYTWHFND